MLDPGRHGVGHRPRVLARGQHTFDRYVSPWLELVDDAASRRTVDRVAGPRPDGDRRLPHAGDPRRDQVGRRHRRHPRLSPTAEIQPQPDQAVLDQIQLAIEGIAA